MKGNVSTGGEAGEVKNMWVKLLMLQLLCIILILVALSRLIAPDIRLNENRQFAETGQRVAETLANACLASSQGKIPSAQPAFDKAGHAPGLVWAFVTGSQGQIIAHSHGVQVHSSTLRSFTSVSSPRTEIAASDGHAPLTVFRRPVRNNHIGTIYVVFQQAYPAQAAQRRIRTILSIVTIILLVMIVLTVAGGKRSLTPVQSLIDTAGQIAREPQAGLQLLPVTTTGLLGRMTTTFNDMLTSLWRYDATLREEEARYRNLSDNAANGIWQATPTGRYLYANPAMARIFGQPSPAALRMHPEDARYVSPDQGAKFIRLLLEQGAVSGFESQIRRGDGQLAWISETARTVRDAQGAVCLWEGSVEDITERRRIEGERSYLANHLRLLLESTGEGIYGVDVRGHCTFINIAGAHMLGYQVSEVLGQNIHELIHHSHLDRSLYPQERSYLYQSIQTGQRFRVDDEVLWRRDGTSFLTEYTTAPLIEGGRTAGAVVTFVDITARKALEAEQKRLLVEALERADHDPLTGLLNHRAFHKRLHEEADRAQRAGSALAVALLDIDNFKFFNDVYGHKVGDEVLCLVADALRGCCRSYDVLARFGGDEFALLIPCAAEETSATLTTHLNERLCGVSYRLPDYDVQIPLGLSLGVALFPTEAATRIDTLEVADDRLRRAKTGGDEDDYAERTRSTLTREREGFSMLDALVTAVDNKDRYTRRHSEDVMRYSVQIAQQLNLDEPIQRLVEMAALVHDVGKIGVPDSILRKPGQLTEEEFAAVRQHPIMGAVIAEAVSGFEETLEAIRHHHERWDGQGYPDGLAGEEIPFLARLMAVADSFSAMTTDRPYRKGMDPNKALDILKQGAGIQWDPHCVEVFLRARGHNDSSTP